MTDTEKIYEWCDRREDAVNQRHGLLVYRQGTLPPSWCASIQVWESTPLHPLLNNGGGAWFPLDGNGFFDREGSTPEKAIASLAKALGL
jgi:hypothetical protein